MWLMTGWRIEKTVPLGLLFGLVLQAAAAIWWAAGKDSHDLGQDRRLAELEKQREKHSDALSEIKDRLSRIEERSVAQYMLLQRIETRLDGPAP